MIDRLIEFSLKNKFIIVRLWIGIGIWELLAMLRAPIDAIPDLSDNHVPVAGRLTLAFLDGSASTSEIESISANYLESLTALPTQASEIQHSIQGRRKSELIAQCVKKLTTRIVRLRLMTNASREQAAGKGRHCTDYPQDGVTSAEGQSEDTTPQQKSLPIESQNSANGIERGLP